jgi:hypothetical protein
LPELTGRRAAALGLVFLAAACGRGTPGRAEWANGNGHDFCQANGIAPQRTMAITLVAAPGGSALSVSGGELAALDPRGDLSGVTLEVDGAPVRARAEGGLQPGDVHRVDFFFDPRPLVRRHPDGFAATLLRNGRRLTQVDGRTPSARAAFARLLACDRKLRFEGGIDTLRDLHVSGG